MFNDSNHHVNLGHINLIASQYLCLIIVFYWLKL